MENKEQIIAQLDVYLSGSMPEKEKKALEEKLAKDSNFRKEWEAYKQMAEDLQRIAWRKEQRVKIKAALAEPPATVRKLPVLILLSVAAACLFLVVAFFLIDPFTRQPSEQDLVKEDSIPGKTDGSGVGDQPDSAVVQTEPGEKQERKEIKSTPETQVQEEAFRSGKTQDKNVLSGTFPFKTLVVQEGKITVAPGAGEVFIEVRSDDKAPKPLYRFLDGKLKIYTAHSEDFSLDKLAVVEVQNSDGSMRFFLKSGGQWCQLKKSGTNELTPEKDESILQILNYE